jgi:hypothetical protein
MFGLGIDKFEFCHKTFHHRSIHQGIQHVGVHPLIPRLY